MQQSDKSVKGFKSAITKLQNGNGGIMKLYSGFWAAVLGSIPSSAMYFGSYETSKRVLFNNYKDRISRPVIHMLAAASGNIMSSFVFVPKDAIKQQMQAIKTGSVPWVKMSPFYINSIKARSSSSVSLPDVIRSILKKKGLKGFYPNYRATLMRNIPSAVVSHESLKLIYSRHVCDTSKRCSTDSFHSLRGVEVTRSEEPGWKQR
jgi:Mitochondrial carrier protein